MDPYLKGCLMTLGTSIAAVILLDTLKWMGTLFRLRGKLPERCIIVRYKDRYNSSEDILIIKTDTPKRLYDEMMTTGPYHYISSKYGMFSIIFRSIDVIGDDIDYTDTFLIKIAKFMNLETKDIHSKEDLIKLIDDHMRYNPDTIINEGYIEARNEFNKISQDI